MADRRTCQQLFSRICKDSGFGLDAVRAAQLTAQALHCHPLEVWMAMPSWTVAEQIAAGTHPSQKE